MPSINVVTTEIPATGGISTNTGTAFIAVTADQGPPAGQTYAQIGSLSQFTEVFGARSAASAAGYDWLDEFFGDGGATAYVTRVTDETAASASLTLSDAAGNPTVKVAAQSVGLGGNGLGVSVSVSTNATFTANTTSSSTSLTNVSSFTNIGVGTPVSGTGIPANSFIEEVNPTAHTALISNEASATGSAVSIIPSGFTVDVLDSNGDVLETHGPFISQAQLLADTASVEVSFTQSSAENFTSNNPTTLTDTALTGGADPDDLEDSAYVGALANFPSSLGPGSVALPGLTSTVAWDGLLEHAAGNNRFAILDMADAATAQAAIDAAEELSEASNLGYGQLIQGSLLLPGISQTGFANRTVSGSAAVAALRAQVAATGGNAAPAGLSWPLRRPIGFTTYYGAIPSFAASAVQFNDGDVGDLEVAGVNVFANYYGTPCLFGYVTPLSRNDDQIFWQGTATAERMALVADCTQAMAAYLFATIDGAGLTISAMAGDLKAIIQNHWTANALYGDTASDAGSVVTGSPVNTPATAQAGELNAALTVRISPYADTVNITINVTPLTQSVPVSS